MEDGRRRRRRETMRAAFTVEHSAPARPAHRRSITPENKLRESRPIAFLCDAVISFSIMSFADVAHFQSPRRCQLSISDSISIPVSCFPSLSSFNLEIWVSFSFTSNQAIPIEAFSVSNESRIITTTSRYYGLIPKPPP